MASSTEIGVKVLRSTERSISLLIQTLAWCQLEKLHLVNFRKSFVCMSFFVKVIEGLASLLCLTMVPALA